MEFSKLSFAVVVIIVLAICNVSAQAGVVSPGDIIVRVDGVNDGDRYYGPPPSGEEVFHAIDGNTQKYLNFLDHNSGFIVTPSIGATVITGLRLYTANDFEERDPASYKLEGSNTGPSGPFTLISQDSLNLPSGRNFSGSAIPDPRLSHQELRFSNNKAYTTYKLTFPTLKNAKAANSMQIGEVEFLEDDQGLQGSFLTECVARVMNIINDYFNSIFQNK
jgi:hypothetical protein